ncbi:hypothetical protein V5F50_19905 [Xanthobacter sp. V13C-7B]|uniref:hypothetical protein n=1 Tax=Xanthobacter variabilis TaxID=3119932 RepID=UPI0037297446
MTTARSNVTSLPIKAPRKTASKRAAPAPVPTQGPNGRFVRQYAAAAGLGLVNLVLIALSLSHLAAGIGLATGVDMWERWAIAIVIDLGVVGLEISQLCAATPARQSAVEVFAKPAMICLLAISAALNALAFSANAPNTIGVYVAAGLGALIPALIYAFSRIVYVMTTPTLPAAKTK